MHDGHEIQSLYDAFLKQQIEIYGDELALDNKVFLAVENTIDEIADWRNCESLQELAEMTKDCQQCVLARTRKKIVFGSGNPAADIVLVGEAPGATEDSLGEPFVGEAGQLLDKILASIQLKRENVYICNIVKCRPPANRDPSPEEINKCSPFLLKQISLIKPAFILCLGRHAAQTLLNTTQALSVLRGKVHTWQDVSLIVTYHPAALLRYPQFKTDVWNDVKLVRRLYDEFLQNKIQ